MRIPISIALCLTASLLMGTGCIKADQIMTIREDGSGYLDISYTLPEQSINQIRAMFNLEKDLARAAGETIPKSEEDDYSRLILNPDENRLRLKIKQYESLGIGLDKLSVKSREGGRFVEIRLSFKTLAGLAKADFFAEHGFAASMTPKGNCSLIRKTKGEEGLARPDFSDPETVELLKPILGGFQMTFTVKTPGNILHSNAHRKSLHSVSWVYEFDKDPNAFYSMQNQERSLTFDGSGIRLGL